MCRWKVICSYDGTEYSGWQSQVNAHSIQDVIERRLSIVFKKTIKIAASGRTDAGVHARGQVFHFDAEWGSGADALQRAIRTTLPKTISIDSVNKVSDSFHARFSAVGKLYVYRYYLGYAPPHLTRYRVSTGTRKLDLESMDAAGKMFEGWHDYRSFAANRGEPYEDTIRYISMVEIRRSGKQLSILVEGNGFLYKMVRAMVGTVTEIARGKLKFTELEALISGEDRTHRVITAPAQGLTLERVYYRDRGYAKR